MICPEDGSINRNKALPSVVFPHPDSPTNPNVSPWKMVKLTLLTAVIIFEDLPKKFLLPLNCTDRFLISINGKPLAGTITGVCCFICSAEGPCIKSATTGNRCPLYWADGLQ